MRVYQFTVPTAKAHLALEESLADLFGGFTRTEGIGAWKNPEGKLEVEDVCIYSVATTDLASLRRFVESSLRNLGEQAAYFAEVGTAQIITL